MGIEPKLCPAGVRSLAARTLCVAAVLAGAWAVAAPMAAQEDGSRCRAPYLIRSYGTDIPDLSVDPEGRICARPAIAGLGHEADASRRRPASTPDRPGPARTFATSLLIPGGGQWLQGQSRAYLYLGVELAAWAGYLEGRIHGGDLRDRYRDLAWRVARDGDGSRTSDGDFRYYEALAEYPESGSWDLDPSRPGIQPETDPETYNGRVWSLARELYSLSGDEEPEARDRALEYYRLHGYPPGMSWDWSGNPDAADRYRNLIEESDDAFRRATIVLGVIAANHLLSAVDGFLSARIASSRSDPVMSSASLATGWNRTRWSLELSLGGRR